MSNITNSHIEMLDEELAKLQERNAIRLEEAKAKLGQRYLLHPSNQITKKKFKQTLKKSKALQLNCT
jgi:hypothetical protein